MLKEGLEIKEYTLRKFLGRGGFGEVWLAEKKIELADRKVLVALKFLSGESQELSDYTNVRREINTWIDASGNKNIVSVLDGFTFDNMFIIVSEYADGGSLHGWLRRNHGKPPNLEKTVEIMNGILDGLAHLHSQKIIHRDLKPENILLKGDVPCIADFGVSRMIETVSLHGTNLAGSPRYMPPESFERAKPAPQTDVWSAGVILYEMLSGRPPFTGDSIPSLIYEIITKQPPPLSSEIPESIRNVVKKALAKNVSERFQTAGEMRAALMKAFYSQDYQQTSAREEFISTIKNIEAESIAPQTLFTEEFFLETLRNNGFVRTFREEKKPKPVIWKWLLTVFGAAFVFLFLVMVGVSLISNKRMLDDAGEKGKVVLNIIKSNSASNPTDKNRQITQLEMDATENLRRVLVQLDEYERKGAPWYMRFGLYSGDKIYREKLLPIYFNAIEWRFKVPVVKKMEDDLRKFSSAGLTGNTEQDETILSENYDLLKAYLMLSGKYRDRAEPAFLTNMLDEYWQTVSGLPPGLHEKSREQIGFYARQIDREQFPSIKTDDKLVDDVRKKLSQYPPVKRYYKRKIVEISKQVEDKFGGVTAEKIVAASGGDSSFIEGSYTVPGAYTAEGRQLIQKAIAEAGEKLNEDDWVIGEKGATDILQTTDVAALEDFYYRDYAEHWKAFVKGLKVKSYDKQNAVEALNSFSSANSPVEILVKEIARQTNLSAKPEPRSWWDWIKSIFGSSQTADTGGNTPVEKEFNPLFVFVGEEKNYNAPVEKYRSVIGQVSNKFNSFSSYEIEQLSRELAGGDYRKFPQFRRAKVDIEDLLRGFNETPTGQEIAGFLKKPLDNLQVLLSAGDQNSLSQTWTGKLLPQAKEIEKGYPFTAEDTEADLVKINTFLNPVNGYLSQFYNDRLKNYFEEFDGRLKLKEASDIKFSEKFVEYLNNAFRLRKALYVEDSPIPRFVYEFKLKTVKDEAVEVVIDGQTASSRETSSVQMRFPATVGNSGVLMKFLSTDSEKKWSGTWGLFKFFDDGSPQKQPDGEYLLTYELDGKTLTAIVKPSVEDLFDKNIFKSVRAPDAILK